MKIPIESPVWPEGRRTAHSAGLFQSIRMTISSDGGASNCSRLRDATAIVNSATVRKDTRSFCRTITKGYILKDLQLDVDITKYC